MGNYQRNPSFLELFGALSGSDNLREFSRHIDQFFVGPSEDVRSTIVAKAEQIKGMPRWGAAEISTALASGAILDQRVRVWASELDLTKFLPTFKGLFNLQESIQRETGKFGFYNLDTSAIVMGPSQQGKKTEVLLDPKLLPAGPHRPNSLLPVFMIHTHPTLPNEPSSFAQSLSAIDFQSFFESPQIQMSIVVTKDKTLIVAKNGSTPTHLSAQEIEKRIVDALDSTREFYAKTLRSDNYANLFTRQVCIEFGCSLFELSEQDNGIAKKVRLIS